VGWQDGQFVLKWNATKDFNVVANCTVSERIDLVLWAWEYQPKLETQQLLSVLCGNLGSLPLALLLISGDLLDPSCVAAAFEVGGEPGL
jgi:hypothetical protein